MEIGMRLDGQMVILPLLIVQMVKSLLKVQNLLVLLAEQQQQDPLIPNILSVRLDRGFAMLSFQ